MTDPVPSEELLYSLIAYESDDELFALLHAHPVLGNYVVPLLATLAGLGTLVRMHGSLLIKPKTEDKVLTLLSVPAEAIDPIQEALLDRELGPYRAELVILAVECPQFICEEAYQLLGALARLVREKQTEEDAEAMLHYRGALRRLLDDGLTTEQAWSWWEEKYDLRSQLLPAEAGSLDNDLKSSEAGVQAT